MTMPTLWSRLTSHGLLILAFMMLNSWIVSLGRSPLPYPVSILTGFAKLKYSSPFGKVCSELIDIRGGSVVWKIRSQTRSYSTLVLERLNLRWVLLFERWLHCPFIVRLLETLISIVVWTESAWAVFCRTNGGCYRMFLKRALTTIANSLLWTKLTTSSLVWGTKIEAG